MVGVWGRAQPAAGTRRLSPTPNYKVRKNLVKASECQAHGTLPMSNHFTPMRLATIVSAYWPQISGTLLTLATAVAIELLAHTPLAFPNPPAVLLLIVVLSAFRGGLRAGLISAAVAWLYIAYFFSIPAHPFQYTGENVRRVLVWAITIPLMALMVGTLHRRALQASAQTDTQSRQLTQLAQRQQALEAEREYDASFRLLFMNNPLPMWVYDLETLHFIEVNAAAMAHYQYSREEFLAMRITDIRPPEDVPRLLEELATPRPAHQLSGPWRHRRKDGTFVVVQIVSHTLFFAERRAALVVAEDITERKQLEAQVLQMQKMESIGRLAGGIAHDFNNLLTVIIGNTELVREVIAADHPAHDDLQAIQAAAQRATSLTHQLLAFARKQHLEARIISLNELIIDMDRLLRRLIREDIELVTLPASDLWRVKVDPGQIEQVLVNLVVNARDAMLDGGQLTIETRNVVLDDTYARGHVSVNPGLYVMLAVSDTGIGMSPEVQTRLFEPFFTTKEPGKGTGLGLATCYGIIKQHSGHVWVYSEIGQGTTIKVYLPQVAEPADARAVSDEAEHMLGTETVLLVEDEPAVRELAARVLRNLGYLVLEAINGTAGLGAAQAHTGQIDLLVADLVMPEVGGKALSEQLIVQYPGLRILFMSGYTDNAIVHHGRLDEGVAFLQKPFTPAALAREVRAVLDAT
jgi:two-component system cell cycle sensor histidine kinase/response regulator CckA